MVIVRAGRFLATAAGRLQAAGAAPIAARSALHVRVDTSQFIGLSATDRYSDGRLHRRRSEPTNVRVHATHSRALSSATGLRRRRALLRRP